MWQTRVYVLDLSTARCLGPYTQRIRRFGVMQMLPIRTWHSDDQQTKTTGLQGELHLICSDGPESFLRSFKRTVRLVPTCKVLLRPGLESSARPISTEAAAVPIRLQLACQVRFNKRFHIRSTFVFEIGDYKCMSAVLLYAKTITGSSQKKMMKRGCRAKS